MSTGLTIFIIVQFVVSVLLIWGYAHEDQVIDFEDRILVRIRAAHSKRTQERHTHHARRAEKHVRRNHTDSYPEDFAA